jgi:hypothetical protein
MSGGGGSQNTTTQVQQIPAFEQQASQQNQAIAQSIGSQPYPVYQAPLIQGMTPLQSQGQSMAVNAAGSYQPDLQMAEAGLNPNAVSAYMNPYVSQALAPQVQQLQMQLGQQQQGINANATEANAYGDARQGAANALQNLYGNNALSGLLGQGYSTAFQQGQQALQGEQGIAANLAGLNQSLGLGGAGAVYTAGQQQQQLGQTELNAAYQQYLNQVNWPIQMLNVQESALSNSPYNIATATTLPSANATAQGFGALAGLGGLLGGLGSGSSGGGATPNVFGAA